MFLATDQAAFDSDLVKLAGFADIGQNLLCGFAQRREYRKLRHQGNPAEKWLPYSTLIPGDEGTLEKDGRRELW